jgi:hypothetical protein
VLSRRRAPYSASNPAGRAGSARCTSCIRPRSPLPGNGLRRGCREIIKRERDNVAVEIDLQDTVDRLADRGERVERGLEKPPLEIPIDSREKDDETGMQRLRGVEAPKVARVVGDENEVAVARVAHDVPIFPASPADVRDVVRLMAGLSGNGNQINAEAFVDQKPHGSAIVSIRRRRRRTG